MRTNQIILSFTFVLVSCFSSAFGCNTYDTLLRSGIDSFSAPSGATFTSSGIFNDTIANGAGCDSVITINLTIYRIWDIYSQVGADIDGEASGDYSGWSVALSTDGSILAIGANGNDGNGSSSGHVRVYKWSGSAWTQMGSDLDGEAANDQSGISISLSADGNRLAIGANGNDGNGSASGHVRVYKWSGLAWTQMGSDLDGEAANDQSGISISLSADGSILAIGATGNDGNGSASRHVRVSKWSGSAWTQMGSDIDGEAAGDASGGSVSLSADGSILAIGAKYNDGTASGAGHMRVYQWSGSTWTQMGADIDGEAAWDEFGFCVSLSATGSRLAIGAKYNDGNGSAAGHVRVYD